MNEIERAIEYIEYNTVDGKPVHAKPLHFKGLKQLEIYFSVCNTILAALREKAERSGGCVWCKEDNKVFHDGQHFHMFCSYCGKRLGVKHGAD